ncbi:MAG TPA: endonuclease/exonuclease/phosphatase family protein [Candidatus Udaeobacter sp.]|jgi:endonuclease/exonuclease/phosphatase family metal-dependent hydrolase|nr:endonuclease/exonuclease/phosphatase family protein [Candidatus Udaeobacter sp.]
MSRDPALLAECRALQHEIQSSRTLDKIRAREDWPALEQRFERLLAVVRHTDPATPPPPPADPSRVRAVQWNIEHGNWYDQVERALLHHPKLAGADLYHFNEIDLGCARAGNRDVTADLAQALGLHSAFLPLYIESTLGRDDDLSTATSNENEEGLFGNAILSRYPIGRTHIVRLPGPIEIQFNTEHMYGHHSALIAEIERPGAPFVAVSAHLEVHRTRDHRAAQIHAVLEALRDEKRPVILAGDFNTHTFDRGLWHAPMHGAAALLLSRTEALHRRLLFPDRGRFHEKLFDELRAAGFEWERYVDHEPTLRLRFDRLDEINAMPPPIEHLVHRWLKWAEARAEMRLDWFAGRGWQGGRGESVQGLDGRGLSSDHAPIVAEFS